MFWGLQRALEQIHGDCSFRKLVPDREAIEIGSGKKV